MAARLHVDLPLLEELRDLDREARKLYSRRDRETGLESVGLILDEVLDQSRYAEFTPLNVRTFARTGGNGVHFGLLVHDDRIDARSPAVVTMPAAFGGADYIVGESLFDFLCLGKDRGYFALEHLAYDEGLTLAAYTDPHWQPSNQHHYWIGFGVDDHDRMVLEYMKTRLGLVDWGAPERFRQLQERYVPLLEIPA